MCRFRVLCKNSACLWWLPSVFCVVFVDWVLGVMETDQNFHRKIIFSDEAHLCLNGLLTKAKSLLFLPVKPSSGLWISITSGETHLVQYILWRHCVTILLQIWKRMCCNYEWKALSFYVDRFFSAIWWYWRGWYLFSGGAWRNGFIARKVRWMAPKIVKSNDIELFSVGPCYITSLFQQTQNSWANIGAESSITGVPGVMTIKTIHIIFRQKKQIGTSPWLASCYYLDTPSNIRWKG